MEETSNSPADELLSLLQKLKVDEDSAKESQNEKESAKPANQECRICLEDIDQESRAGLQCGHSFHLSCIQTWTANRNTCPYCKTIISTIEFDYDKETDKARQSMAVDEPVTDDLSIIHMASTEVTNGVTLEIRGPLPTDESFRIINTSRTQNIQLVHRNGSFLEVPAGQSAFLTPLDHIAVRVGQHHICLRGHVLTVVHDMLAQLEEEEDSDDEDIDWRPTPNRRATRRTARGGRWGRGGRRGR